MSNLLKARPTTYRGIEMRSRLEARFAAGLDSLGARWVYEPRAFADSHRQYLPDFQLHPPGGATYIEVKPTLLHALEALEKGAVIFANRDGFTRFVVACPDLGSFVLVREHGTHKDCPSVQALPYALGHWAVWEDGDVTIQPIDSGIYSDPFTSMSALAECAAAGLFRTQFDWSWQ